MKTVDLHIITYPSFSKRQNTFDIKSSCTSGKSGPHTWLSWAKNEIAWLFVCLFVFVHNPLLILYVRDFLSCLSSSAGCTIPWEENLNWCKHPSSQFILMNDLLILRNIVWINSRYGDFYKSGCVNCFHLWSQTGKMVMGSCSEDYSVLFPVGEPISFLSGRVFCGRS